MNKAGTMETKKNIYENHLGTMFGKLRLDQIDEAQIARFRAQLVSKQLSQKTINDILGVLSKPLRYAEEVRLLNRAPRIGMLKVERPAGRWIELEQYPLLLEGAQVEGTMWYVAACLTGEAGLRIGEVKALDWQRDCDLVGRALTINQQTRKGETGTPKGRTRRTVPMTDRLLEALKSLEVLRRGFVVRNPDGTAMTDGQASHAFERIRARMGLPICGWHIARHSFAIHAALFGANPWRLMAWLGHKQIEETMRYVHVAEQHPRPLPEGIAKAGAAEPDPDRRILRMLHARGNLTATEKALQANHL
jgi:integrase